MRIVKISSIILMAGLLTACASNSRDDEPRGGFDRANRALNTGDYITAHEGFACIASRGQGFEVAQHNAGLASLYMSEDTSLTDEERQLLRARGLGELTLSANAGWPASQAALAEYYFERGDDEALNRAGYWLLLYSTNNRETALGIQRLPAERQDQIFVAVGEERMTAAREEAFDYRIAPLTASRPSPTCAPWFVRAGPQRQRREPPQGRAPRTEPPRAPGRGTGQQTPY